MLGCSTSARSPAQLQVHQLRPELGGPGLGVLLAEDGEGAQLVGDAAGVNTGQSHLRWEEPVIKLLLRETELT